MRDLVVSLKDLQKWIFVKSFNAQEIINIDNAILANVLKSI